METYTRKQLKERWEKAKTYICGIGYVCPPNRHLYIPGLWEVTIFPRWFFKGFNDRKIIEPPDSAIMSRNEFYDPDDPDSEDTQEWGWFHWRYYFDAEEDCYLLKLDYNVEPGDTKPLPLVRGILDVCLLESPSSIIGKFKWRSRWLQRVPILRRIPPIFLFYFQMNRINFPDITLETLIDAHKSEVIRFPKGSESWGKVKFAVIGDPRGEGRCIACITIFDTGDGQTFTAEYDICFQ